MESTICCRRDDHDARALACACGRDHSWNFPVVIMPIIICFAVDFKKKKKLSLQTKEEEQSTFLRGDAVMLEKNCMKAQERAICSVTSRLSVSE